MVVIYKECVYICHACLY